MVNDGQIEIEEEASKSHVALSNTISMEEVVEALSSYPSPPWTFKIIVEANKNDGIPTVLLPPMAIPVQFMIGDEVQIVWVYPNLPRDGPRQPTLYKIMTCSDIEDLFSNDDDDNFSDLECRTCTSRKTSQPGMTQSSATLDFRIIGRNPTKKKNKKKVKKDKKKKLPITDSDEDYVQPNRVPITLKDFVPKGILKYDSSKDDAFWGCTGDTKINRILLDCGSAVNLLPFRVLKSMD
ncbi:hypothetical protein V2J09_006327 [Rumex salicifolius]